MNLSEEERAVLRKVDPDGHFEDLNDRLTRCARRLMEIDNVLAPEVAGKQLPPPSGARKQALLQEKQDLMVLQSDLTAVLEETRRQNLARIDEYKNNRARVIRESEDLLRTVGDCSSKFDRLLREAAQTLQQRAQALEALFPLLTENEIKKLKRGQHIAEAMGQAGLREYLQLPGAPESDRLRLQDHDAQLIAPNVRREVLRIKQLEANDNVH